MRINAQVIPHAYQRYDTIGDWRFVTVPVYVPWLKDRKSDIELQINVSDLGNDKYNMLVMIHEIVEALLCYYFGVTEKQVDDWDMSHLDSEEPGDEPGCPYAWQHSIATGVERLLAAIMGIDWAEYGEAVRKL